MLRSKVLAKWTTTALALCLAFPVFAQDAPPTGTETITIHTVPCKKKRTAPMTSMGGVLKMIISGPPKDKLVHKGELELEGRTHTFYLPKARHYSVVNTGKTDTDEDNTSTLVSIDDNADGKLAYHERWYANLPIRLGSKMYQITAITDDGSTIELQPSDAPLRGLIVGQPCPAFSFQSTAGDTIDFATLRGKAVLLDVWSVT